MNEEFRPGSKLPTVEKQIEAAMSQEHDLPPAPKRMSYLICSSPRTGSNLLCAALWKTQMAGRPFEYLQPTAVAVYRRRIETPRFATPHEYLRLLYAQRTTPNGVFGLKLHFSDFNTCFRNTSDKHKLLRSFDHIIVLGRRNKLAQAISNTRALATSAWFAANDVEAAEIRRRPVRYHAAAIAKSLAFCIAEDAGWRSTIEGFALEHHRVHYEELVEDFSSQISNVLTYLNLPEAIHKVVKDMPTSKLGDGVNIAWERRFLSEISGRRDRIGGCAP
jgi:trehalose 2-sulfotransferase